MKHSFGFLQEDLKPIRSVRYDLLETYEQHRERMARHNERLTLWHQCKMLETGSYDYNGVPDSVWYADGDHTIVINTPERK